MDIIQELIDKKDYLNLAILRDMAIDKTVDAKMIDKFFKETAQEIIGKLQAKAINEIENFGEHRTFENNNDELNYFCEIYIKTYPVNQAETVKFKLSIFDDELNEYKLFEIK